MYRSKLLAVTDAGAVARLHQAAFANFFLTSLGIGFLNQFYKSIIRRDDTISIGYWNESDHLVGFLVANFNHRGFYKSLCKENLIGFITSTFHVFILKPYLLIRLLKSFTSKISSKQVDQYPYLLSVCVDPNVQSKGLGTQMVNDLIDRLQTKGYKGVYLTTDTDGNEAVNLFYKKNGFVSQGTYYQGKRQMTIYLKEFSSYL